MQIYLIFFLEGHYFLDIQYIYIYLLIVLRRRPSHDEQTGKNVNENSPKDYITVLYRDD